jgi:3-hydroxyacyl-CoA dehydrogenase
LQVATRLLPSPLLLSSSCILLASSPDPLSGDDISRLFLSARLKIGSSLADAVRDADIVQEQGPENEAFKKDIWANIERAAPPTCLFWSSTSGIPASTQATDMESPSRLLVVHPYNPPHIMPLLEIVPSPATDPAVVERTLAYWRHSERVPVVLGRETAGFVANRLAFALLREAVHLVNEGVVSPRDVDRIVENSMGPRWMLAGPFKSYHAGGGAGGLASFFDNIGETIQACWDDSGKVNMGEGWEESVSKEVRETYGERDPVELQKRNEMTKLLLSVRDQNS